MLCYFQVISSTLKSFWRSAYARNLPICILNSVEKTKLYCDTPTDKVILKSTFAFSFIQKSANQWEGKIKIGYCSEYKCSDTRQEYDINVLPNKSLAITNYLIT